MEDSCCRPSALFLEALKRVTSEQSSFRPHGNGSVTAATPPVAPSSSSSSSSSSAAAAVVVQPDLSEGASPSVEQDAAHSGANGDGEDAGKLLHADKRASRVPAPPKEPPPRGRPRPRSAVCLSTSTASVRASSSDAKVLSIGGPVDVQDPKGLLGSTRTAVGSLRTCLRPAIAKTFAGDAVARAEGAQQKHGSTKSSFMDPRIERSHFLQAVQLMRERNGGYPPARPQSATARLDAASQAR